MTLQNLSYIGHYGNFITDEQDHKSDSSKSGIYKMSLYSNAFDFEGVAEILSGGGIFSIGNSEISDVTGSVNSTLENSHNVKMLTFGLDSIFQVGQSGLLPNLEGLSILKYMDISSMMAGLKLPSVVKLPLDIGGKKK
jgi:hypothetical protein